MTYEDNVKKKDVLQVTEAYFKKKKIASIIKEKQVCYITKQPALIKQTKPLTFA